MRKDDGMIKDICRLVSIDSVSGPAEGEFPFGKKPYLALCECLDICRSLGMRTKQCGNYMGYAEIGSGDRLVGVLSHLDVVPAGSGWETDPFEGVVKDSKLYGRGTADDKGPAMAAVYAAKDILDSGKPLDKRIRFIFGCTEETGEWKDLEYYKATEELPQAGFTPDADFPLTYAEKGIANLIIKFKEPAGGITAVSGGEAINMVPPLCSAVIKTADGKELTVERKGVAAHASTPEEGVNAIALVMEEICRMNESGACSSPFAELYMKKFGKTTDGSLAGCYMEDEVSGAITINPGLISMEDGVISVAVDIRYPVTQTADRVLAQFKESFGPEAEVVLDYDEAPMYIDKDSHLVQTLLSVYRKVTGDMTEPFTMGGGTYARSMDNIVAFGPAFPGKTSTEHQCNEYVELEDLYKAREIYRLALEAL